MSDSLKLLNNPKINLTILSVRWDDISGPSIISIYPPSVLDDPESVALQIYLASVTVFGQHAASQRTKFSVPLLSLGKGISVRVAFDSWKDESIRGKERPFFLAFLTDEKTNKILGEHLDEFIFKYLDILEVKKEEFDAEKVWEEINNSYISSHHSDISNQIFLDQNSPYAISRALEDLENAKRIWNKEKDRNQLWTVLRIVNRLENVEDKAAADAFTLIAEIFLENNNYQEAKEAFEKASNAYSRVKMFEKFGETSYLAGKCAYNLHNYNQAIELLQTSAMWIKDEKLKAALNYDIGIVLHEQKKYEEANSFFERAISLADYLEKYKAANFFSTYASKLMIQAENEKENNPTYSLGLIRRSAELRRKSAKLLQTIEKHQITAASSLILSASSYFSLGNLDEGIKVIEEAAELFIQGNDFFSAAKSLFDGSRKSNDSEKSYKLLIRAQKLLQEGNGSKKESYLLGLIFSEKAEIEVEKNQIQLALDSYNLAIHYLKDSATNLHNLIPIQIQYAKILFKIEEFEKAAKMFLDINTEELESNESSKLQKEKIMTNALISLRRASTVYHNSGIIHLQKQEISRAIEMFTQSVSLLIDWSEFKKLEDNDETKKVLDDRIGTLKLKLDFLIQAESKYKFQALIDILMKAKDSLV